MNRYDAIVVGARCRISDGHLLARKGTRPPRRPCDLPSDTISTHLIHPPGVTALNRWGYSAGCWRLDARPIHTYAFDMGPFVISGAPGSSDSPVSYGPRRTVLDKLLVDAASEAGAEVREGFSVDDILIENGNVTGIRGHGAGGRPVTEQARVVVGADGLHSLVSRMVGAEQVQRKTGVSSGLLHVLERAGDRGRFEATDRGDRAWAGWPTNDGLTLVVVSWPFAQFESNRGISSAITSRRSNGRRRSRIASIAPDGKSASSARPCRTSSANRSAQAGRSSGTPATTRTSSRPRGSATLSGMPSSWSLRSTSGCPGLVRSRSRWAGTSPHVTGTSRRSTSSRASSDAGSPTARNAAAARGRARQSGRDERFCPSYLGCGVTGRVFFQGERRTDLCRGRDATRGDRIRGSS